MPGKPGCPEDASNSWGSVMPVAGQGIWVESDVLLGTPEITHTCDITGKCRTQAGSTEHRTGRDPLRSPAVRALDVGL